MRKTLLALMAAGALALGVTACNNGSGLQENPEKHTPKINSTPTLAVNEGESYNYKIDAKDEDGNALNYSLLTAPTWLSVSNDGIVSGTAPIIDADIVAPVSVKVSNGDYSATQEFNLRNKDLETRAAIKKGGDRLVSTQNNDGGWEWQSPDTNPAIGTSAVNTMGITAMGLLATYTETNDIQYLNAAKKTGDTLVAKNEDNFYSQDIEFLAMLGELSKESKYSNKALEVMEHFMTEDNKYDEVGGNGCTAKELADKYASIYPNAKDAGLTEWQLASWVRAAKLTGKESWAKDLVSEIEEDVSTGYFNINSTSGLHAIGLAGVLYATESDVASGRLIVNQQSGGNWTSDNTEGDVQDTSYAMMALIKSKKMLPAKEGLKYLIAEQNVSGGWADVALENTEDTSEAVQALTYFIK